MPKNTQVRTIVIKGVVQGDKDFKRLARQIGTIQKSTVSLSKSFSGLRNIFAAGFLALGIREITDAIDSFQLLEDRIRVFTGDAESASNVFNQLGDAASFTKTSVDSLAQSYNRVALATNELGLSQEEILATTTLLQQTFRISGATIAEATSSTIQLAQGLSSGQLRGQELRSVLEQNAVFANLLSKELNITRGQLIKFAETGQITSDRVLKALFSNFKEINSQAGNLQVTIGQALTIAFDRARFVLRDLNKEFEITRRVSEGILFVADNLATVVKVATAAFAVFITPKILAGLGAVASILFSIEGAVAVIGGGIILAAATWETSGLRIEIAINKVLTGVENLKLSFNDLVSGLVKDFNFLFGSDFNIGDVFDSESAKRNIETITTETDKLNKQLEKLNTQTTGKGNSFEDFLSGVAENFNTTNKLTRVATGQFAALNQQFGKGFDILQNYRNAYEQLRFDQINADFAQGKITLQQYVEEFTKLNSQVEKLSTGTQILKGFQLGLNDTFNGVGNLITNVRNATNATFNQLEDRLLEFVKTGKFQFADFAQFVLDELTKIVIRLAIIRPLAQGIFGGTTSPTFSTPTTSQQFTTSAGNAAVAANGHALNRGNIIPFATGGIVDRPTNFGMSGGRVGLMGEAGPEAIIPLERGPNGKLGVNATGASGVVVNVNNFTNSDVEVRESTSNSGERELEIIINNSVAKGIGEGRFDRQFQQSYNLQRRGS